MSDKRGIFSLEEFYDLQVSGESTDIFDVFKYVTLISDNGYFAGGYPSYNPESRITRYDYSNDTVSDVSTFGSIGNYNGGTFLRQNQAIGNSSFAYFTGSWGWSQKVVKYDYANDTTDGVQVGPTNVPIDSGAAVGNLNFGYFCGSSGPAYSGVERIDYANDTNFSSTRGPLSQARYYLSGCGNTNYGYLAGGQYGPGSKTTIDRITFASDNVTATPKGSCPGSGGGGMREHAASGNADFGYLTGGTPGSTRTFRIDYANDTNTTSARGNMNIERRDHGQTGSGSFGYTAAGRNTPFPTGMTLTDRIDYANDTNTASPKGTMPRSVFWLGAVSAKNNGLPEAPIPLSRVEGSKTVDKGSDGFRTIVNQSSGPAYGYFAGGYGTPANNVTYSTTDRIDYANDTNTATFRTNMPNSGNSGQQNKASVSSVSYAWFAGGGNYSNNIAQVTRLDYANDTSFSARGSLSESRYYAAGVGNKDFGYIGGGSHPSSPSYPNPLGTWIDRIDYANDSPTTQRKGSLTAAVTYTAATGNLSFGYWGGGESSPGGWKSEVSRLDYSNDTAATAPKGSLTEARGKHGATGNADFGYFMGGRTGSAGYSTVDRIDYSNDTATALDRHPLVSVSAVGMYDNRGITGNSTHGYMGGGTAWGYGVQSAVYKTDYANDTASPSPKGPLTLARGGLASASAREGDQSGTVFSPYASRIRFIDNLPMSSGTILNNVGYFAGGYYPAASPSGSSSIDRLDFANDSGTASRRTGFMQSGNIYYSYRERKVAVGNQFFGYFAGDAPGSNTRLIEKLDYSNDTDTPVIRGDEAVPPSPGSMYVNNIRGAATGNLSFGYFSGSGWTYISRIDYSNDNTNMSPKGNLTGYRYDCGATGNLNFGYFMGGDNARSKVDRIDYSNDTATAASKGNLARNVEGHRSTGDANFGYTMGGYNPSTNATGTQRVDYANDTDTAVIKGGLLAAQRFQGVTSSHTHGYSGGGQPASSTTPTISNMYRLDYANDTNNTVSKGPLSEPRYYLGATSPLINGFPTRIEPLSAVGPAPFERPFSYPVQLHNNKNYGYFAAGYSTSPSSMVLSQTQRIDYTNDTATAVLKGNLTIPGPAQSDKQSGTGSPNHGYIAGGNPASTNADRIDYANDTATALLKSNVLTVAASRLAAVGNASYGYFAGGHTGGTIISRLDYSNDDGGGASKGNLTVTGTGKTGVGNQSYGYVSGGIFKTTVDRIDYDNDTATATPKGPLAAQGYARGATGNGSYGYIAGGSPETVSGTNIQRIDYANDSNTALLKGTISESKFYLCGTGDQSYGYFGGGRENTDPAYPDITSTSKIERIDFSNDTATASPKGPLAIAFREGAAVSAAANANT